MKLIQIRELSNITEDFLAVLSELSDVGLTLEEARKIKYNSKIYVAVHGERIVGTISLFIEQKFIHQGGKVCHIEDVVVSKEYRNMGIGKRLVQHGINEAKKYGCYKVILQCFEEVTSFYEEIGFKKFNLGMRLNLD